MSGQGYVSATRRSGQVANNCDDDDDDEHSGREDSRREVRHRARTEKRIVSMREVLLFIVVSRECGRQKAAGERKSRVRRQKTGDDSVCKAARAGWLDARLAEGRIRLVLTDEDACAVGE